MKDYFHTKEFQAFLQVAEEFKKQLEHPQVWPIAEGKLDEDYDCLKAAAKRAFKVMCED